MRYIISFIILCSVAFALENTARIVKVTGTAEVLRLKAVSWALCEVNGTIVEGERVRTGLRSNIELELANGTVIRTGEATVLDLSVINLEKKSRLDLLTGKLISKIQKLTGEGSDFSITTPTALASVRGTEFGISFEPSTLENKLVVFEGAVAVSAPSNEQKTITLKRNETVDFRKADVPPTAQIYNPVKEAGTWDLKKYTKTRADLINIDRNKKW